MKAKFKKLHPSAELPTYAKLGDAGMDLYACVDKDTQGAFKGEDGKYRIRIYPATRKLIPTELSMELPFGYEAQVRSKSGLALKNGISVLNSPGTIDAGYRGPVGIILINHGHSFFDAVHGSKIAQMVIKSVEQAEIEEVDELSDSERGEGGFGSTGQ